VPYTPPRSSLRSQSTVHTTEPRHIGFIGLNRKLLAFGAIAAAGALMSIPALPASAEVVVEEAAIVSLQSYVAPTSFSIPVATRDSFGVSSYSLMQWPLPETTTISSGFGYRDCSGCSSDHRGIDLNPGDGTPVHAVADGVVVLAEGSDSGLGVHVVIEHVVDGQVVRSLYGHMQFGSLAVAVGQTVSRGQQLGLVGSTGQSTGPHLHFGILIDGVEIDPYSWLLQHANTPFAATP